MSNTLIRLVPLKKQGHRQTIYYDPIKGCYFTREMPPKKGYNLALFIAFLTSAIIGTILWVGKFFFPLPKITLSNPVFWWAGFILAILLPTFFWLMAYRQEKNDEQWRKELSPCSLSQEERTWLRNKWRFERGWIIFVLVLLPPTSLLFIILYVVKMNLIDAVLYTLHATLFMRRLQPDVWQRIKFTGKEIR